MTRGTSKYHHGQLSAALVAAALEILAEGEPDKLTVREAARRVGVSSGAPFRHFPNRAALLAAVGEEAIRRLGEEIRATDDPTSTDALGRYEQIGMAYLRWAFSYPAHFQIVSTPGLIEEDAAAGLREENQLLITLTENVLREAALKGQVLAEDVPDILVAGRALVYGLARMRLDGHFPRWGVAENDVDSSAKAALKFFIAKIRQPPRARPTERRP